ncbi:MULTISPECIES: N-acetyl-gamma-glutamyl-phosphate reductase [Desulfococcus]|jgi:N-acetyl-gamma-glutamyl-phosphate reductase|uniref:N-acetyl-gamma-glutamyl-phosphate reductase n=1 Tax=Desulfococcus multivorans DSM 2059 TaxID=1121405 RepID=S7VKA6_DESML|nr:N-acetyl-gamma-glutamyl-phosphate reductase [Desulfococcus multivorans]AOY59196.1 ArgC: N-acetyl-gamma-glutamyl-phosphate reductase [Desulfococcus multivorans]AQV01422.1 N-acetyl-gamma-glutamyl-phosphate reductase [Desulfococcus multivorans]EPR45003.1 N-acetyl-gamma-glutamyl-phosphate reductase [Desulfococcus multivorans DSM 2059]MDX9818960.1 N-acetyl-gamma-glutamyl-phosphate reductase [Desulfococcus multivorans]SJZ85410.1 N-acetyl-gamma-glutamyl-phosphate reductase [Desulfococcus multivora
MVKVGIVGATGYAGAELVRILFGHPKVALSVITSRQYAGVPFDQVFPAMKGVVDLTCEEFSMEEMCRRTDVVFTALPHKIPMEIVPRLVARDKRVIDLSADFRFRDVKRYEAFYQPHTAPSLSAAAVYGLPEVYGDVISQARVVGNPGCYPTSVLLPLVPLLKAGLIRSEGLVADAKSGVSGAGRSPSLGSLYCEVTESFKAYKVGGHRHNPEMDEVLSLVAGDPVHITFVPHLVPMSRGMLTTLYAVPKESVTGEEILECLKSFYAGRPFVRICPEGQVPSTGHVRGTNYCDVGIVFDADQRRLILISAIDNLVKGAAGQAVQNMNMMLGFDESAGLNAVPYPI